jgi:2-keto-3-deoxy-6-phosphogluconate aldolase
MSTSIINEPNFVAMLKERMNKEMQQAAEPVIQKALQEIEVAMRKQLAENLIALIDRQFSVNRMGDDIVIHIRQEPKR